MADHMISRLNVKVSKIIYNEQIHRKLAVKAYANTYLMSVFFMNQESCYKLGI